MFRRREGRGRGGKEGGREGGRGERMLRRWGEGGWGKAYGVRGGGRKQKSYTQQGSPTGTHDSTK